MVQCPKCGFSQDITNINTDTDPIICKNCHYKWVVIRDNKSSTSFYNHKYSKKIDSMQLSKVSLNKVPSNMLLERLKSKKVTNKNNALIRNNTIVENVKGFSSSDFYDVNPYGKKQLKKEDLNNREDIVALDRNKLDTSFRNQQSSKIPQESAKKTHVFKDNGSFDRSSVKPRDKSVLQVAIPRNYEYKEKIKTEHIPNKPVPAQGVHHIEEQQMPEDYKEIQNNYSTVDKKNKFNQHNPIEVKSSYDLSKNRDNSGYRSHSSDSERGYNINQPRVGERNHNLSGIRMDMNPDLQRSNKDKLSTPQNTNLSKTNNISVDNYKKSENNQSSHSKNVTKNPNAGSNRSDRAQNPEHAKEQTTKIPYQQGNVGLQDAYTPGSLASNQNGVKDYQRPNEKEQTAQNVDYIPGTIAKDYQKPQSNLNPQHNPNSSAVNHDARNSNSVTPNPHLDKPKINSEITSIADVRTNLRNEHLNKPNSNSANVKPKEMYSNIVTRLEESEEYKKQLQKKQEEERKRKEHKDRAFAVHNKSKLQELKQKFANEFKSDLDDEIDEKSTRDSHDPRDATARNRANNHMNSHDGNDKHSDRNHPNQKNKKDNMVRLKRAFSNTENALHESKLDLRGTETSDKKSSKSIKQSILSLLKEDMEYDSDSEKKGNKFDLLAFLKSLIDEIISSFKGTKLPKSSGLLDKAVIDGDSGKSNSVKTINFLSIKELSEWFNNYLQNKNARIRLTIYVILLLVASTGLILIYQSDAVNPSVNKQDKIVLDNPTNGPKSLPVLTNSGKTSYIKPDHIEGDVPLILGDDIEQNNNSAQEKDVELHNQKDSKVVDREKFLSPTPDIAADDPYNDAPSDVVLQDKDSSNSFLGTINEYKLGLKRLANNTLSDLKVSQSTTTWLSGALSNDIETKFVLSNKSRLSTYNIKDITVLFLNEQGNTLGSKIMKINKSLSPLENVRLVLRINDAPVETQQTSITISKFTKN